MVVSNDHDCPRGNKGEGIVRWALYIPAKSSTPVKSIEYGKTGQTNTPCVVPKPSPPPDVWIENGITYQLNGGNGRGGWHKDCILKVDPQSPLMIDLNDEKIRLTSPDAGTRFDLEGNGAAEMYSWPSNPDNSVFLAYDKNGDGIINDVHELFGNNTVGPDGKKTSNGFEALKKYDLNQDGTIDSLDGIFPKLRVWFAYSKDGKPTTPSVLKTLGDVGIKSIDLDYLERIEKNGPYGDMSRQRSTIGTKDGRPRNVFDMWLVSY